MFIASIVTSSDFRLLYSVFCLLFLLHALGALREQHLYNKNMNYSSLIKRLYSLNQSGMKLGLQNMERLCAAFGNSKNRIEAIHVAGTNGKGSVVTKIAKAYELMGKKAGLYTSPHISSFRERIAINGEKISKADVERLLNTIFDVIEKENIQATFFEITTLLGFLYFAEKQVDVMVLETGLGGRLDATNVIDKPAMCVITSIDYDHMELLGDTLEKIAFEKAGIIKNKCPVVIGPRVPVNVIQSVADPLQSPLTVVEGDFTNFHEENNAIAKEALLRLGLPFCVIEQSLASLPPCRMEKIETSQGIAILDAAHNPDGLRHLFEALPDRKYPIVVGLSKSKDCTSCVRLLKEHAESLYLVCAKNGRGLETKALKQMFLNAGFQGKIKEYKNVESGVREALSENQEILICGTFFIMGPARQALEIEEDQDELELN